MFGNTEDYDSGYEEGYEDGSKATYDEAYKDGHEAGMITGKEEGYESGKEEGGKEAREELDNIVYNLNQEIYSYRAMIRTMKEQIKDLRIENATITRTISESTRDRNL